MADLAHPQPFLARAVRGADRRLQTQLQRAFHRRYRADTGGYVYLDDLGLKGDGRVYYHGSDWIPLTLALRRLRLGPADVVADLGAGKGAGVLLAARQPVRRVIGVELSEQLAGVARANVERNRGRLRAQSVEVVTSDVLDWQPPEDLTVIYLYNPFVGPLFRRAIEPIIDAHVASGRPLRLLYNYPWEHNWLMATGKVRTLDVAPRVWPPLPGWWKQRQVLVTYGVGDAPYPPPRGRVAPAAASAYWSASNDARFTFGRGGDPDDVEP